MNDMSRVIQPKSDQQNADDFMAGPRTFHIERVEIKPVPDQPVSIWLRGEPRPWKPCKSMSRVLVAAWGADASVYAGRSLTLYRDPSVKWGGMQVGGIRVSHLSDIDREMVMALTETKGKRSPYVVRPLASAPQSAQEPPRKEPDTFTLIGIKGPPYRKTRSGITEAIETLETADPDVVAANDAWLADMAERVPAMADRIAAVRARAVATPAGDDDGCPGPR